MGRWWQRRRIDGVGGGRLVVRTTTYYLLLLCPTLVLEDAVTAWAGIQPGASASSTSGKGREERGNEK